ncbi:unnamed protein product [Phyllotreta striolata]|uniref:Intraflagellar transport protein 46 homolog n=1 Tax=Phyllotreta striolata TaxID=444603 RepID=A0A9N9XLN5_PHYSR|nr:unnamed protein product [Phyllotreta striolata]
MQRSFSVIDDDDDDGDEVFLPEGNPKETATKSYKTNSESDLSFSEQSSISPKRIEKEVKEQSSYSEEEKILVDDRIPSPGSYKRDNAKEKCLLRSRIMKSHYFSDSNDSEIEDEINTRRGNYSSKSNYITEQEPPEPPPPKELLLSDVTVPPLIFTYSDEDDCDYPEQSPTAEVPTNLSGRQTAVLKRRTLNEPKMEHLMSDSDDSYNETKAGDLPGEYNPKDFEQLEVDDEVKDLFQFISRYTPQQINLTHKFKPFVPEYLPAVGDIDAFLKVYPPESTVDDEKRTESFEHLGLTVLDEPASNQSDPAVLYLRLRAASGNPRRKDDENAVVKKIDDVEKNAKTIEKWIKDISDLHKSKSSVAMRFTEPMPDLDDLMQEWPEAVENELKEKGFPKPDGVPLEQYVSVVCNLFQIPQAKKKIQSVYLLFCLYAAIKQTQLYKASSSSIDDGRAQVPMSKNQTDQLVLE